MNRIEKICLIDDDLSHVFLTKKNLELEAKFVDILEFNNGKEAYESLRNMCATGTELPDLILLDINMPIWDGWNFLDAFGEMYIKKDIVIFIISNSMNPFDQHKADRYPLVNGFLSKPVTYDKLLAGLNGLDIAV